MCHRYYSSLVVPNKGAPRMGSRHVARRRRPSQPIFYSLQWDKGRSDLSNSLRSFVRKGGVVHYKCHVHPREDCF